jgi:uncharacterized membrane protein YhaH (DUF805 family)
MMTFQESIKTCFTKYVDFSGRATRSEYWWLQLFFIIGYVILSILTTAVHEIFGIPMLIFSLAFILPSLAAGVRRLHDVDKSGWWLLISLVPLVGLVLIYFMAIAGTSGNNRFGTPSTK